MSKTYSMAGWRIGFAVGNARLIAALARVKSYLDYGAFTPVQAAAVRRAQRAAGHRRRTTATLYKKRRDVLVECFGRAGWDIPVPAGLDVRLGADPRALPRPRRDGILQAAADRGRMSRSRRASASARKAKASSASRWSRTSSACARRRAA